jgi:hypothetical protein
MGSKLPEKSRMTRNEALYVKNFVYKRREGATFILIAN